MAATHPDSTSAAPPERIGAFCIRQQLGEGGMGVVYLAQHERIPEQRVAIKVLHHNLSRDEKSLARFFNEARAISIIQHPGMVKIFDHGQTADGLAYILMEYLEGESLARRMERLREAGERIPKEQALQLCAQMAAALTAAHARGIVHRDLKPENVYIVPDPVAPGGERTKILDFGIAKFLTDAPGRRTTVGMVLGTPTYMAPEQCEGREDLGDRVDVYALGVMLYELLSGNPPFVAETTGALLRQHMFKEPPPLPALGAAADPIIASLLAAMLAKEPKARPSMAEVLERLGGKRPAPPRRRWLVPAVALGVALVVGSVLLVVLSGLRKPPAPVSAPVARPAPRPAPVAPPVPAAVAGGKEEVAAPAKDRQGPAAPTRSGSRKPGRRTGPGEQKQAAADTSPGARGRGEEKARPTGPAATPPTTAVPTRDDMVLH